VADSESVETGSLEAFIIGFDLKSIKAVMISALDCSNGEQYTRGAIYMGSDIHREETRLPFWLTIKPRLSPSLTDKANAKPMQSLSR
jgi:hypothetical protein